MTNLIRSTLFEIQEVSLLAWRALRSLSQKPLYLKETLRQMDIIGFGSLTIILLTGFFTGAVLGLQSSNVLRNFGASTTIGQLVTLSLVRELGPVLSALMIAGRVGSGIAAELGSMVVTEQISAMRALGTDPIKKLILPRMIACIWMMPLLTIVTDFVGVVGGWLIALSELHFSSSFYWSSVINSLKYSDLVIGITKPFFFGYIISLIACHMGLRTTGGTQGVGNATTQSVVVASILIIVTDFFLSKIIIFITG